MNSENIKNNLKSSCAILDKYKWLIDLYVLDFYVDKHWSRISSTWREFFQDVTPKDLAFLIDLECDEEVQNLDKVWPLEILAIKAAVKAYSLKRKPWTRQQVSTLLNLGKKLIFKTENSSKASKNFPCFRKWK